jgi:SAM-dependent methyltransferase
VYRATKDESTVQERSSVEEKMDFASLGYNIPAATPDTWRWYDATDPQPGYFQFDWLSARYPDLYHRFALSTVGLTNELGCLVDLDDLIVVDVGAGTGRSSIGVAQRARHVYAVDAFESVVAFGSRLVQELGLENIEYSVGDRSQLPFGDDHADVAMSAWADLDWKEAYRVVRPGGWVVHMAGVGPDELTPVLAADYPQLVPQMWDPSHLTAERPSEDASFDVSGHPDIKLVDNRMHVREFTYVADYGEPEETVAIFGRLFGPRVAAYLRDRGGSTVWSRLRILYGQVPK